ncbi:hypothetical protein EV401DRAFT_582705 [Pisolithus croceorrhizus]|nr:hypothetical protein EV401DRAFT_582705 [Pisolithus croceorrhizus]
MDNAVGECCTVLCCGVLSGICLDFMTIRRRCTETLCPCRCCWCSEGDLVEMPDNPDERQPLNPKVSHQPSSHAPMRCTS